MPTVGLSSSQTRVSYTFNSLPKSQHVVLAYGTEIPSTFKLPHAKVSIYSLKLTGYASQRTSGIMTTNVQIEPSAEKYLDLKNLPVSGTMTRTQCNPHDLPQNPTWATAPSPGIRSSIARKCCSSSHTVKRAKKKPKKSTNIPKTLKARALS